MFSASANWVESRSDDVTIQVVDPNVTIEALDVALGSLYQARRTFYCVCTHISGIYPFHLVNDFGTELILEPKMAVL